MKHAAEHDVPLDPTDGRDAAEINSAARVLHAAWDALPVTDELGDGGPRDYLEALIAMLAGDLADEAEPGLLDTFKHAANQMISNTESLQHWR